MSVELFMMDQILYLFFLEDRGSIPVLQVSFISLQRSFTEEALRPRAAPIVAQSFPCFSLSLIQINVNINDL